MWNVEPQVATFRVAVQEVTDGFHLVIDALKLQRHRHDLRLPGIPIPDFTRMAQAQAWRVFLFVFAMSRTPATPPLSSPGFMTQKPGICLTVSAPGFPQRLADRAGQSPYHQCASR